MPAQYQGNDLSPAFASDLSGLFERAGRWPEVCVHGHIHQAVKHGMLKTTLLANPYGYQHQEVGTGFNLSAAVALSQAGEIDLA